MGRATDSSIFRLLYVTISIHALRGEGDVSPSPKEAVETISIHALRGEGDHFCFSCFLISNKISIHALRGEGDIEDEEEETEIVEISIHALRGEGDIPIVTFRNDDSNFNPRPPWGGRRI